MNLNVEKAVAKYPNLTVKVNKGDRHRIMHRAIKNQKGSLWVRPHIKAYRIYSTGEVISYLGAYISQTYGAPSGQDMERDYWFLESVKDVEDIIREYGELQI